MHVDASILRRKEHRGAIVKIARALNLNQSTVSQWRRVPAEYVAEIEAATGISRHELRPDIWPPEGEA